MIALRRAMLSTVSQTISYFASRLVGNAQDEVFDYGDLILNWAKAQDVRSSARLGRLTGPPPHPFDNCDDNNVHPSDRADLWLHRRLSSAQTTCCRPACSWTIF